MCLCRFCESIVINTQRHASQDHRAQLHAEIASNEKENEFTFRTREASRDTYEGAPLERTTGRVSTRTSRAVTSRKTEKSAEC